MKNKFMVGLWRYIIKFPPFLWEKHISKAKKKFEAANTFMSKEHRLVHHFVVKELPFIGKPLSQDVIADRLGMSIDRVKLILDDLEAHMTFVFRNRQGDVVWAYPVTVEQTPHHVSFHTGEQLYAA